MSEYWKSTPKYWCKHCSVFVRDTGLERANHESTAKHQGAIKRSLRDLHRNADQKEREKERAKREVDRLNGVVSGSSGSGSASSASRPGTKSSGGAYGAPPPQPQLVSQAERQKQLEQLADLGVSIPTELRGNMAMAGEWTVTSTKVIAKLGDSTDDKDLAAAEGRATGVKRERERTEEEKEQEEAIKGLFKKPRKWGVGSKTMPLEEDAELDALLSGPLVTAKKEESEAASVKTGDIQEEGAGADVSEPAKQEPSEPSEPSPPIKKELDEEETGLGVGATEEKASGLPPSVAGAEGAAVVFKKRKPKNLRQK